MNTKTPVRSGNRDTSRANAVRRSEGNYRSREATGVIQADESFTQEAFLGRMGITRTKFNDMRRRGLVVRRDGGRVMVLGSDYLRYLGSLPEAVLNDKPDRESP